MRKLVIVLVLIASACAAYAADSINPEFFSQQELEGAWHNQKWPKPLRDVLGLSDLGEKDYETLYFVGDKYVLLGSDMKYLNLGDVKTLNMNDFKLDSSNPKAQWIAFYVAPDWFYIGISKITPDTSIKKEIDGRVIVELRPGDMILTYYNQDGKIVYRRQFRKAAE